MILRSLRPVSLLSHAEENSGDLSALTGVGSGTVSVQPPCKLPSRACRRGGGLRSYVLEVVLYEVGKNSMPMLDAALGGTGRCRIDRKGSPAPSPAVGGMCDSRDHPSVWNAIGSYRGSGASHARGSADVAVQQLLPTPAVMLRASPPWFKPCCGEVSGQEGPDGGTRLLLRGSSFQGGNGEELCGAFVLQYSIGPDIDWMVWKPLRPFVLGEGNNVWSLGEES